MFNIGAGEMLVIFLLALLILGPDKLPETARKVGRVMADLRRMSNGFQQEMRQAMDIDKLTPNQGPTLPAMDTTSSVVDTDTDKDTADTASSAPDGSPGDGSTPSAPGPTGPAPADAPTEIKASAREMRSDRSDGPSAHGEQGAA